MCVKLKKVELDLVEDPKKKFGKFAKLNPVMLMMPVFDKSLNSGDDDAREMAKDIKRGLKGPVNEINIYAQKLIEEYNKAKNIYEASAKKFLNYISKNQSKIFIIVWNLLDSAKDEKVKEAIKSQYFNLNIKEANELLEKIKKSFFCANDKNLKEAIYTKFIMPCIEKIEALGYSVHNFFKVVDMANEDFLKIKTSQAFTEFLYDNDNQKERLPFGDLQNIVNNKLIPDIGKEVQDQLDVVSKKVKDFHKILEKLEKLKVKKT